MLAWKRGEEAPWPRRPDLRFAVHDRVERRLTPDPTTGWVPGTIVSLYYREPWWPPTTVVPYEVLLDDGTFIFAPKDVDAVIRLQQPSSFPRLCNLETAPQTQQRALSPLSLDANDTNGNNSTG